MICNNDPQIKIKTEMQKTISDRKIKTRQIHFISFNVIQNYH